MERYYLSCVRVLHSGHQASNIYNRKKKTDVYTQGNHYNSNVCVQSITIQLARLRQNIFDTFVLLYKSLFY